MISCRSKNITSSIYGNFDGSLKISKYMWNRSVVWAVAQTTIKKSKFLSILMKLALEGGLRVPSSAVIVVGSFSLEG